MSKREQLAEDMQQAVNELSFLQTAVNFEPERAFHALQRAKVLLGSAALILACPETFDC